MKKQLCLNRERSGKDPGRWWGKIRDGGNNSVRSRAGACLARLDYRSIESYTINV